MNQPTQPQESAEKARRFRAGVATKLRAIQNEIQDFRSEMREVLAAQMTRKSISHSESDYGD